MALHKNHPAENISIHAASEDGMLFYFNSSQGEMHVGAAAIMSPISGIDSALVETLKTSLSAQFPANTIVHCSQLCNLDIDHMVHTSLSGKLGVHPILDRLCTNQADFILNGKNRDTAVVSSSQLPVNKRTVIIGIKIPIASFLLSDEEHKETVSMVETFFDGLSSAQLSFNRIDEKGYRELVFSVFNPFEVQKGSVQEWDTTNPLREQILPVGSSIEYGTASSKKTTIKFNEGEYFARLMSVNFFPRSASPWIMNDVVGDPQGIHNQITGPYYLSLVMIYPDQEQAKAALALKSGTINNQATPTIIRMIPEVGERKDGVDILVNEVSGKGGVIVDVNLSLIVFSKTERHLEQLTSKLQAYFSTLGGFGRKFDLRVDKRVLRPVFEQSLPLNASTRGLAGSFRLKTVAIKHAVVFMPIYGDFVLPASPTGSLFLTRRNQLSGIDFYDSATNYNGIIFAESGAGKSFIIQALMVDQLASGGRVWFIDDGRSMEKTARILGGQVITFNQSSNICLNPFTTIQPGELENELDLLKTLFTKMAAPNDGLSDQELPVLEKAIIQSYENHSNKASVRTVADFLTSSEDEMARRIGEQLYPFARGQFSQWFNGDSNIDFRSNIVVLEMGDLKQIPILKDVVALQLFASITRSMQNTANSQRKMLVIEEAKQWLYDPIMAKGIEEAYARSRKFDGAAICVTQSLLDIDESPRGPSIMSNTAWQLILKQKTESINRAIERGALSIDPNGARLLKEIRTVPGQYSEFMYKRDDYYGVFRAIYPLETQVLFSSKGDDRNIILNAIDEGMDPLKAYEQYLQAMDV